MLGKDINKYVLNYMENDMTNLAVMLTGEWGSGKTHYIKNELIPFLEKENKKYCLVSLYGINKVEEIAKSIFIEQHFRKAKEKSGTKFETGKVVGKSLLRAVMDKVGLKIDENDMQSIYESADLTNTLVILEDLERSGVDIVEVLGYVNNLLESDGVKVLFVANENSILNKPLLSLDPGIRSIELHNIKEEKSKGDEEEEDEKSKEYKSIKEKTIGDTISFDPNYRQAIDVIIKKYENSKEGKIIKNIPSYEIEDLIKSYCYGNLRTFKYALQKTVGLIKELNSEQQKDRDFIKNLFYSNTIFSGKCKRGEFPEWEERISNCSGRLSNSQYPLFRFSYNYFRWNQIDKNEIKKTYEEFKVNKMNDRNIGKTDRFLNNIYNFYILDEETINQSIEVVDTNILLNKTPYYEYPKIMAYLIRINTVMGIDYTEIKGNMISNLKGKDVRFSYEYFNDRYLILDDKETEEYNSFLEESKEVIQKQEQEVEFSYDSNDIEDLQKRIEKQTCYIENHHRFISKFDISLIVNMLFNASSKQIMLFRDMIFHLYGEVDKEYCEKQDIQELVKFRELLEERKKESRNIFDKIQFYQMELLISDLDDDILKLT